MSALRGIVTVAACLLAAVVLAVSASGGSPPTLVVYSGQHPGTIDALVTAFEQKTGIYVEVRSAIDATLATLLVVEGSHSPADVFVAENSPALEDLQERNMLAPVDPATLAKTPRRDNSLQGDWVGIAAHASLLVYNTDDLKASQLPHSVLALADPQWKGKLALAPSETDFQPIIVAVAAKYGDVRTISWLNGLRTNANGNVDSNNTAIVSQVNAGQAELAVIDPYYWYQLRDEFGASATHTALRFLAPGDPGYVVDVSGAGILKSSSHQAEAQEFLAFMVGRQGQEALARNETYEYPLGAGVAADPALYPWAKLRPDPITPAELGNGQLAVTLMQQTGLL